jgi:hypothetical protein
MTRILPKPPKEVPINRDVNSLTLGFRTKVVAFLARMHELGSTGAYIGEALRTNARQRFIWGFGREYNDGRGQVTNAKTAEKSLHAYGCAIDVWDRDNPKEPWAPKNPTQFYANVVKACKELGIRWGGDWNGNGILDQKLVDRPHIQDLRAPISPTAQDQKDFLAGRLKTVLTRWKIEH